MYIDKPVEVYVDRIVEVIKEVIVEKPVEVIREVVKYLPAPTEESGSTTPRDYTEKELTSADKGSYPQTNRRKKSSVTLSEEQLPRSPNSSRVTPHTENFSNEKFLDEDMK